MRDDKRQARMREIEAEAYGLFSELGFEGTSMLAVAKRAKASNETLYRWYGDKSGLFKSMVAANAERVRAALIEAEAGGGSAMEQLRRVAPVLLAMLLSDRAILLNRAAASDPKGTLGALLTQAGREAVLPLIESVVRRAGEEGALRAAPGQAALLAKLLVGDSQIRRVIGSLPEPTPEEVTRQAQEAIRQFEVLCQP